MRATRSPKRRYAAAIAGAVVAAAGAFAGAALAAGTFSDAVGDSSPALDVTSVTASEAAGILTVRVAIAKREMLPSGSRVDVWFDLDNNAATGDEGDEALARYGANGTLSFFRWNGRDLVRASATGMSASFSGGVLTYSTPRSALDDVSSFGLLVITRATQEIDSEELTAGDIAPEVGRLQYHAPGPVSLEDRAGDVPAAPDVARVRVSDAKHGMIRFAIASSDTVFPHGKRLVIAVDRDLLGGDSADERAEVLLAYTDGRIALRRWDPLEEEWVEDEAPRGLRAAAANGLVVVELHRSELDDVARFGFAVKSEAEDEDGDVVALDIAPDEEMWTYKLSHRPPLRLVPDGLFGTPSRPVAGKPFTVNMPVRRSDTSRLLTKGSVECSVTAGGRRIAARASLDDGVAKCILTVPRRALAIHGSMTVTSAGRSLEAWFSGAVDFGGGVARG